MARKDSEATRAAALKQLGAYQAKQEAFENARRRRKRDNRVWGSLAGAVIAIAILAQVGFSLWGTPATPSASPNPTAADRKIPSAAIAQNRVWNASLGINNIPLYVLLDGKSAPQAVSSTITLAQSGFYRNVSCHRLTTAGIFVLQCGDPKGDGTGGPGYSFGPIESAPANGIYPAGTIAMARQANNPSSQGSQFFIVYKDSPIPADSAGGYTVIGTIKSGLPQLMKAVIDKGVEGGATDGKPAVSASINYFDILG